jgi:hypothetical protein
MERSGMRDRSIDIVRSAPDFASLHPSYEPVRSFSNRAITSFGSRRAFAISTASRPRSARSAQFKHGANAMLFLKNAKDSGVLPHGACEGTTPLYQAAGVLQKIV